MALEEMPVSRIHIFHRVVCTILPFMLSCLFTPHSIKPKSTWTLLKPSFETLVSSFVFPQLSFNAIKQTLWEEDPVDYVRISVGMLLSVYFHHTPAIRYTNNTAKAILPRRV